MTGITRAEDASAICTRLYALGYGEGVNQLGISKANPTGMPYIDADTLTKYGKIEKIWTDLRYQLPDNLYAAALSKIHTLQNPKITYSIDAVEFFNQSGISTDKLNVGEIVKIIDDDIGLNTAIRVVKKSKSNLEVDYLNCQIDISTDWKNVNGLGDLYERAKIQETYAQGATNITPYNFHQNCDVSFPAKIRFKIPEEAVYINKVEFSFQTAPFQAYSKAIKGGGGSLNTTGGGGGSQQTSSSGGGTSTSTTSGGGTSTSTSSGGHTSTSTTSGGGGYQSATSDSTTNVWDMGGSYSPPEVTSRAGTPEHAHGVTTHKHPHSHSVSLPDHAHSVTVQDHTHSVNIQSHAHDVSIQAHTHSLNIPAHNHALTLLDHTHAIEYGIYEGATANQFTIKVDNSTIPIVSPCDDFSIVNYLGKSGSDGRINRGWHEIIITPNNLCMLDVQLNIQTFINSRGGGNY